MRRVLCGALACLFMLLPFCWSVQASGTEYILEDLGFSIIFPSGYAVFTPDISENDPLLLDFGFSREAMVGLMESKNMRVDAISRETMDEITIVANPSSVTDDFYTESFLPTLQSGMQEMAGEHLEIYQCSLYELAGKNLLYMTFYNGDVLSEGAGYTLISEGNAINITIWPADREISEADEVLLRSVVDSIRFLSEENEPEKETPPFSYVSPQTGIRFTVPAHWREEPLSKEYDILEAKFASVVDGGITILYGCKDLWAAMSFAEKSGLTREDIGLTYISITDIKEIAGQDGTVEMAAYNGHVYYFVKTPIEGESFGITINGIMTQMIRIENGWMHSFYFFGDESSPFFRDFEQLLETVEYGVPSESKQETRPSLPTEEHTEPKTEPQREKEEPTVNRAPAVSKKNKTDNKVLIPLLILAGEAVVAVVVILLIRRKKKNRGETVNFCPYCGRELPRGNRYCNYCGKKLPKK